MSFKLGKGFGLFDFDENGRLNPLSDMGMPDPAPVIQEFLIDREMMGRLSEAGVDLAGFFLGNDADREQLLADAGLDPDDFDFFESFFDDDDLDDDDDDDDDDLSFS